MRAQGGNGEATGRGRDGASRSAREASVEGATAPAREHGSLPSPPLLGRDGNGYPLPTYPAGKNPIRVRVWEKKILMGM